MEDMDAIYRRHVHTVYKFLLAQCREPDLAEELTQETFYQAVRSIDRFDGSCKLSIWLCQIAKHLWYQQLRKRQKAPVPLDEVAQTGLQTTLRPKYLYVCTDDGGEKFPYSVVCDILPSKLSRRVLSRAPVPPAA